MRSVPKTVGFGTLRCSRRSFTESAVCTFSGNDLFGTILETDSTARSKAGWYRQRNGLSSDEPQSTTTIEQEAIGCGSGNGDKDGWRF